MSLLSCTAVLVPKFLRSENVAIIANFNRHRARIYHNWNFFDLLLQNSRIPKLATVLNNNVFARLPAHQEL